MSTKEQLWYLINGLLDGSYEIKTFCSEFVRIYNLETDYRLLSADENCKFNDLCEMAERFSDDEDELKIPNMYFSEEKIMKRAEHIKKILKNY